MITRFKGDNEFLSNFFPCKVVFESLAYPSSEHAFQAAKAFEKRYKRQFTIHPGLTLSKNPAPVLTAGQAKRMGKKIPIRPDWDEVKLDVMYHVVFAKFEQNLALRDLLVMTCPQKLIEGNHWGDRFWGAVWEDGEWVGENHLGKTLMKVRKFFEASSSP